MHSIRTKEGVGRGISLLHFFLHVAIYSLGRHVCIDLPSIITYLPTYLPILLLMAITASRARSGATCGLAGIADEESADETFMCEAEGGGRG